MYNIFLLLLEKKDAILRFTLFRLPFLKTQGHGHIRENISLRNRIYDYYWSKWVQSSGKKQEKL